jgi:adenylate cyclase
MKTYERPEDEWHDLLTGEHPHFQQKSPLRFIPSSPRCKLCAAPFGRPGAMVFRRYGFGPWEKNPRICKRCLGAMETHAKSCPGPTGDEGLGGAEVELSMLFADVRGSSKLARQMPVWDFTRLMNRFYAESTQVLIEADGIIEKFIGDEVAALFLPFLAGPDHARKAVEAAGALLRATGHSSAEGPWCPLGVGVHTGTAFVGFVKAKSAGDFTALGDPVNVTAHLASQAAIGEVLVTAQAAAAASLADEDFERRQLSLKGFPVEALVLSGRPAPAAIADDRTP